MQEKNYTSIEESIIIEIVSIFYTCTFGCKASISCPPSLPSFWNHQLKVIRQAREKLPSMGQNSRKKGKKLAKQGSGLMFVRLNTYKRVGQINEYTEDKS